MALLLQSSMVRSWREPHGQELKSVSPGYGGFSHSMTPFFSPALLTFIKAYRGILAVPNIRGGAEFGESWHLQGVKEHRPQVFDDFICAT